MNYTSPLHSGVTLIFTTWAYPEPGKRGFTWHKKNRFAWTRLLGNTHLHIQSSGQKSTLTIQNVTRSDYGYYRVTATNDVGTYDQYMELLEKGSQLSNMCRRHNYDLYFIIIIIFMLHTQAKSFSIF